MKSIFIGHGSPMNAISENEYTKYVSTVGKRIPEPRCIVVFSAHWLTKGTFITGSEKPRQIYDFYGFPRELYQVQYAPPGSPDIAKALSSQVPEIHIDHDRGIDHAAWAVIKHMFPSCTVPVLEMSLNADFGEIDHFNLGEKIADSNFDDVLFIGSGNIVHNLHEIDFDTAAKPFQWAVECNDWVKNKVHENKIGDLIDAKRLMPNYKRASPTDDHYIPLLYVLGFSQGSVAVEYDEIQNGSISMLSVSV